MKIGLLLVVTTVLLGQEPGTPLSNTPRKLTIEEAEAIAIKQNPRISAALLDALAANQVTIEARSYFFPQVLGSVTGVGGEYNTRIAAGGLNASSIYNRFAGGAGVTQLITDFGRTGGLVQSAKLRAQSLDRRSEFSRALVLVQVRRAFYSALRSRSVLQVAEQTVATRSVVADQVNALTQSNLRSGLDASFANVNLAEARLLLSQARNDVKASDADLSSALGFAQPQVFDLVETSMPAPPDAVPAPMIQTALRERADVQSARTELASAQRFTAAEAALSRPTISAAAVAGVAPFRGEGVNDHYSAAGVNLSIPIFNGRLFSARREEADLRARAIAERVRDLELQVARDVQVAWLNTNNAFERVQLTAELVRQATLALELSQARYDLGLSSIVELTQAQLGKTSADIQRATAVYEFQIQTSVLAYQQGLLK